MTQIVIIAEIFQGMIRPVTFELAAAALKIKKLNMEKKYPGKKTPQMEIPGVVKIIVPADDPLPLADEISKRMDFDVIGLRIPGLKTYNSDIYKQCLSQLIKKIKPSHILAANTSQGRDFAPGLAVRLKAASISGVNQIRSDDQGLIYSRPVLGNTRNMIIRSMPDTPVVLTLMPGVFKQDLPDNKKKGKIEICEIPFTPVSGTTAKLKESSRIDKPVSAKSNSKNRILHQQILQKSCENPALKGAQIVVAAGRGIGKQENLEAIFKFAKCFSSSAVGASRPLVDLGWIGYEHQVGITGAAISPKLYIACGISGSSQHLAGIKDAEVVVSINKNPAAPIFRHSDLCIQAEALEFIQAFLELPRADLVTYRPANNKA
ncbi:MAG: electron transfer flavoprotein subunit alpha/FixB family protein [Thermodesulfobacteriota bacterium]|nr:electron transfer flavoprotein subunit alpha/FixB family protein [Thermodesulfobacteriota bacterium]